MKYFSIIYPVLLFAVNTGCNQKQVFKNPDGYDFSNPERFSMPSALDEISGISFSNGNADTLYAIQDEDGKLFHFRVGDKKLNSVKFADKGDYEDMTVCNGIIVVLRSDGVLVTLPLSEAGNEDVSKSTKLITDLLPKGEYEGISSVSNKNQLFILCKDCRDDKKGETTSGYILKIDSLGQLSQNGGFSINLKEIERLSKSHNIDFHPSALAMNYNTNEWFIISSVNKMLVITDSGWKVKKVFAFNPEIFEQPEGITFDKQNNLYISSEKNTTDKAVINKFTLKKIK